MKFFFCGPFFFPPAEEKTYELVPLLLLLLLVEVSDWYFQKTYLQRCDFMNDSAGLMIDSVIEKGLSGQRTKMGGGDKETAYKVKSSSLKRLFMMICTLGLVLLACVMLYSTLYTKQRAMFLRSVVTGKKRTAVDKAKTIRLGQQLQAALSTTDEVESRVLNRVNQVVMNRFSELLKKVNSGLDGEEVEAEILDARATLVSYIKSPRWLI